MIDYQFVTDRLAIGGAINSTENMQKIARAGFTHVVDMQLEFDDRTIVGDTGVQVLWLECADDFQPKPSELFWDGALFALGALDHPKGRVLFHCAAGIHRGPMMLLAVLCVLGHEPEKAMRLIQRARPQAEFPSVYLESVEDFVREYIASAAASEDDRGDAPESEAADSVD